MGGRLSPSDWQTKGEPHWHEHVCAVRCSHSAEHGQELQPMTFSTWRSFLTQNRRTQFFCDTDRISSGCSLAATQQRWVSSLCVSSPRKGKTLLQHSTACWEKEMEHVKELRDKELKNNKNNNKIKGSAGCVAHTRISSIHKGGWDRVTVRLREPQLETLSQRNKGRRCRGGEPS